MPNLKIRDDNGFAILEFSILFVVTSILIFGIWGLVSMLQAQRALEYQTDKIFYEQTLPIWKLGSDLKLKLDTLELDQYLEAEASNLYDSISAVNALTPGKESFVELAIAKLRIDENSGSPLGAPEIFKTARRGSSGFVTSDIQEVSSFEALFSQLNRVTSEGVSLWAVPFSKGSQALSYRDTAVFVAARVFVDADGFAAWFKDILGFEPVFFISRAYALRGDVEL